MTDWDRLVEQLARRAHQLRDPSAVARVHAQRGELLHHLGVLDAAAEAHWSALTASANHLPSIIALRRLALQTDDRELMARLFDRASGVLDLPGIDSADAAEMHTFFLLVWCVRWPDPERARAAFEGLGVCADIEDAARFAPLALLPEQRIPLTRHQLQGGQDWALASRLARLLVDQPAPPEDAVALLHAAGPQDPDAAWRLVELQAGRSDDEAEAALVDALLSLAEQTAGRAAATLRFLAAERIEFILGDRARAATLYAAAEGGDLRLAMQIKGLLARISTAPEPAARASGISELAVDEQVLGGVLAARAATLFQRAGDADQAWRAAETAFRLRGGDAESEALVLSLGVRGGRWRGIVDLLSPGVSAAHRAILSAALEHGLQDPAGALGALGSMDRARGDLYGLRARQRLTLHGPRSIHVRAAQLEADALEDGDHRAALYLAIARDYLAQDSAQEKATTYLFWVLDQDPEHLTALSLLAEQCRGTHRRRPLMEVLGRALPLLDSPRDRFPIQRELAQLWLDLERPDRAADLYLAALQSRPEDADTLARVVELRAGDPAAQRAAYETALAATLPAARRAELALALGRLLGEDAGKDWLKEGLAVAPEGPVREALMAELGLSRPPAPVPPPPLPPPLPEAPEAPTAPVPDALFEEDIELEDLVTEVAGVPEAEAETRDTMPLPRLAPISASFEGPLGGTPPPLVAPKADDSAAMDFLGEEVSRPAEADPGRAVVARKLRMARRGARAEEWPDHGRADLHDLVGQIAQAEDLDSRFVSTFQLGEAYADAGFVEDAVKALRAALGYRAGAPGVEARLEAIFREAEDWRGLAELLSRQAHRTGDRQRQRALLVEVARLEAGALGDPAAAAEHYREALRVGGKDLSLVREFADTLRAVGRWEEYVEVLVAAGLADPETADPEEALTIGRVMLYELQKPAEALPYVVKAARAMPARVEVAADLAEARAATGEVGRAERLLRDAIDAAPSALARQVLLVRLARLYEEHAHDEDQARLTFREAIRTGLDDLVTLEHVERLAIAVRDWDTLADVLERMREVGIARDADVDTRRNLAVRLGHLYFRRLDIPDRAAQAFVEAYELAPADLSVFRVVEGLLERHPQPALQIRLYQAFLAHERPADARRMAVGLRLVAAFEAADRIDEAIAELEALRRVAPGDTELEAALERVYRRGERWPALVSMYRRMLEEAGRNDDLRAPILRRLGGALETGLRDLPRATEIYRELLQLDPADLTSLRAVSRLLEAQKRWMELLEVSDLELAMTSGRRQQAYIHFRKGSLLETQIGDIPGAIDAYRQALRLDPRCFPALHGLRDIAASEGDWLRVVDNLREELALWDEPKEQAAILARIAAIHAEYLADPAEATRHYKRAIEVNPGCVPAARALADEAFGRDDHEAAAPYLQMLSAQNMDKWSRSARADLFYKRGVTAAALGRNLEASESLKLALDFDERHDAALFALVRLYHGRLDDSGYGAVMARLAARFEAYQESGDRAGIAAVHRLQGDTAAAALDLGRAVEHYRLAAAAQPDDLAGYAALVELYVRQRRWTHATDVLRGFADALESRVVADDQLRATYVKALVWAGQLWAEGAVDPEAAIGCFTRILRVEPGASEALLGVAECRYLQGDFAAAKIALQRSLEAADHTPRTRAHALFYLGRVAAASGSGDPAALYREALTVDPACASAVLALLQIEPDAPRRAALIEASTALFRPSARGPATGALQLHLAGLRRREGQIEAARQLLSALAESDHPAARDARFALVEVNAAAGDLEAAAAPLFRTLDGDICDVAALRALADVLTRHGDEERLLHVLSALQLYRALGDDERTRLQGLQARAHRVAERGSKALSPSVFSRDVAHPSFHSPLVILVGLCEPALAKRFPVRPRPDLRRGDLVGRRHPFAGELKAIQNLLGVRDFDVAFADVQDGGLWPGDRPLLVLDPADQLLAEPEQRFVVGRAAALVRADLARLAALGPERGLELVRMLASLITPQLDQRHDPEALLAELPARALGAVEAVIRESASTTLPAVFTGEAVLTGIGRTADRVGLLSARGLRATVELILRGEGGAGPKPAPGADLTWAVRSNARLRELVKYSLSESYRRVRHAVGLSI